MRYVVDTPWGRFTRRTSSREYQFVVVTCGKSEAHIRAWYEKTQHYLDLERAGYEEGIRTGKQSSRISPFNRLENYAAYLEGIVEQLDKLPARLERALALNAAQIAAKKGSQSGWCSRRDLADKEADRARRAGFVNVHIYSCVDHAPYTLAQEVA